MNGSGAMLIMILVDLGLITCGFALGIKYANWKRKKKRKRKK